ncbi:MAG: hypothetical protein ABEJ04_04235 [Halobacteriaceae archaeon]
MNKHFEDARYYLNRAAENAKEGVKHEIEPIEERFREMTGREQEEEEPEPSRLEQVQDDLREVEQKAEGEARRAISSARGRIDRYRRNAD